MTYDTIGAPPQKELLAIFEHTIYRNAENGHTVAGIAPEWKADASTWAQDGQPVPIAVFPLTKERLNE